MKKGFANEELVPNSVSSSGAWKKAWVMLK